MRGHTKNLKSLTFTVREILKVENRDFQFLSVVVVVVVVVVVPVEVFCAATPDQTIRTRALIDGSSELL